jgi:hypothetical protein
MPTRGLARLTGCRSDTELVERPSSFVACVICWFAAARIWPTAAVSPMDSGTSASRIATVT